MGVTRMHRMEEETHPPLGIYHPSQDPPLVVQPNKDHELTASSVRGHWIPDFSVPPLQRIPTRHHRTTACCQAKQSKYQ